MGKVKASRRNPRKLKGKPCNYKVRVTKFCHYLPLKVFLTCLDPRPHAVITEPGQILRWLTACSDAKPSKYLDRSRSNYS